MLKQFGEEGLVIAIRASTLQKRTLTSYYPSSKGPHSGTDDVATTHIAIATSTSAGGVLLQVRSSKFDSLKA